MKYREWIRSLATPESIATITQEVKNPTTGKNSPRLMDKTKEFNPDVKSKSGSTAFATTVAKTISEGLNWTILKNSFKLLKKICEASKSYGIFGASLEAMYNTIRKPIRERYGKDSQQYNDSIRLMKFPSAVWTARAKDYSDKVIARNRNRINFDGNKIFEIMDDISKNSTGWADLAVMCLLASGSRSDELLSLATYTAVAGKPKYILQTGIAKQSNKDIDKQRLSVEKPIVHISRARFLKAVSNIRQQLDDDIKKFKGDHYALSNSKNSTLNKAVQKWFGYREDMKVSSHTLRGLYTSMADSIFRSPNVESEIAFANKVLGHASDSLSVAQSYLHYNVNFDKPDDPDEKDPEEKDPLEGVNRNTKQKNGEGMTRMLVSVLQMKKRKIEINRKNLIILGYGTKLVSEYLRTA